MVLKYTYEGVLYLDPPYSDVERDYIKQHLYGPPIAMYGSRPGRAPASPPESARPRQAKPSRLSKRRRAELRDLEEELNSRLGLSPVLQWMVRNGRPLTAESYLNLQGVPEEQLGYDEQRTLDLLRQIERWQAKQRRATKRPRAK